MDNPPAGESTRGGRSAARLATLVAALAGFGVGLHYARMGYMPLDQSIAFDGGWRVLSGEVPLRDYLAPNGFPMHAAQAVCFALFGVNWLALCLHAALVNAAACALTLGVLVRVGLGPWRALVFALATAFVFSPPFGTPYMETHAFLFSLAALAAALSVIGAKSGGARRACAFAVGPLLATAYLDKQIPSVFFLPACLALSAFAPDGRWLALRRMLSGLALSALALALSAWGLGLDLELADVYLRQLPAEEGARRLDYVPGIASVLRRFEETRQQLDLWSITVVHLTALAAALAWLWRRLARRERPGETWRRALGAAVLAEFLLLACLGFIALTSNDKELGVPLVFVAAGLSSCALAFAGAALGPRAARIGVALSLLLTLVAARDAWSFDERVNRTRKVNDIAFDAATAEREAPHLPEALERLRWSTPKLVQYTPADLHAVAEHLRQRDGAFLLLGDASVLYGLTGKPSVFPSLWFHPGLTFPLPYDPRFAQFEALLIERCERFRVRTIVIEPRVWIGYRAPEGETPKARFVSLATFPRLEQFVSERRVSERSLGAFRVIELR